MEDEITIFSRIISRDEYNDDYLIALTSEADTQLSAVSVISVDIKNVISTGTPIISIKFVDAHGDLVNINRLNTDAEYYLYFGTSKVDASRLPLKISRIDFANNDSGRSDVYGFTVFFVMSNWDSLIQDVHSRGWRNTKYSDVVAEIASECGFSEIDVSTSKEVRSSVVQPHWSNLSLLRDIRKKAIPNDTTGHYEFGVNLDNSFFFLSTEELVNRSISRYGGDGEVPLLKLHGSPENQSEREELKKSNDGIPANFVQFFSSERFMDSVLQGAGGVESQYYDFESRRFVRTKNTFSESDEKTLSEWAYVHPSNEKSSLKYYGGRNSQVAIEAQTRVSDVMMSTNMFQISSHGSVDFEIGGVIELIIPTPPDKNKAQYNEMYSGFYWVVEVEHMFNLKDGKGTFVSLLTLARNGMNGKDLEGYVASSGGRII